MSWVKSQQKHLKKFQTVGISFAYNQNFHINKMHIGILKMGSLYFHVMTWVTTGVTSRLILLHIQDINFTHNVHKQTCATKYRNRDQDSFMANTNVKAT